MTTYTPQTTFLTRYLQTLNGATPNTAAAAFYASLDHIHSTAPTIAAAILQESAYDPRALSAAGAIGIAQFEPETAQAEGIDPFDPSQSIAGAADLLSSYVRRYDAYPVPFVEALAAYNAGPGAVDEHHGVPPYPETKTYVAQIVDRWAKIAGYERPISRR